MTANDTKIEIKQPVTLEEISAKIGISRTTIYKVLNHKGEVSDKTRRIILEALKSYNYTPNNNARNLARNRLYPITLIDFVSKDAAYFAPTIKSGIDQVNEEFGAHGLTALHQTAPADHHEAQIDFINEALNLGIKHFVIAAADEKLLEKEIRKLQQQNCEIILLSKKLKSFPELTYIGIDEYQCGRLAAEVLSKALGRSGVIQTLCADESTSNSYTLAMRYSGFLEKIKEYPQKKIAKPIYKSKDQKSIESAVKKCCKNQEKIGFFDLTFKLETIAGTLDKIKQKEAIETFLVGSDLSSEIAGLIKKGTIDAVIFQDLKAQTILACKLLFEKMCYAKDYVHKDYFAKLEIVMQENLNYFN